MADRNVSAPNTVARIQSLSKKYKSTGQGNFILRPWQQYAAADAIGALDGAGLGGAVAGPWGAVCGGITYGVFASCALDMFNMVIPNTDNPPVDGSNPTIPGTTVGANEAGNYHNPALTHILTNAGDFGGSGTPDLTALKTYLVNDVSSHYGFDDSTLTNIVNSCQPFDTIAAYAENPASYFASLGDNDFRTVSETFYNTAFSIADENSLKSYYNAFVETISGTTEFTDTQKAALMVYGSIATASIMYHNE